MIVQACINGARPATFHPRLPTTPDAIITDGAAAVAAGANELHVHLRGEDGKETLAPAIADRIVKGLRDRLPGTPIGVSTGAWIEKDDARRRQHIGAWREAPDYASVNLSEADAPYLFRQLTGRGIGVEAGLATLADAERLVTEGLAPLTLRVLIEIDAQDESAAHAIAGGIVERLTKAGIRKPILIHGADATVWSFVERAAKSRYSTRVGLEDGATLPDGSVAGSNAALVAAARRIMFG